MRHQLKLAAASVLLCLGIPAVPACARSAHARRSHSSPAAKQKRVIDLLTEEVRLQKEQIALLTQKQKQLEWFAAANTILTNFLTESDRIWEKDLDQLSATAGPDLDCNLSDMSDAEVRALCRSLLDEANRSIQKRVDLYRDTGKKLGRLPK